MSRSAKVLKPALVFVAGALVIAAGAFLVIREPIPNQTSPLDDAFADLEAITKMESPVLNGYAMEFLDSRDYKEIDGGGGALTSHSVYQKAPECVIFLGFSVMQGRGFDHYLCEASVRAPDNSGGGNYPWQIVYPFWDGFELSLIESETRSPEERNSDVQPESDDPFDDPAGKPPRGQNRVGRGF